MGLRDEAINEGGMVEVQTDEVPDYLVSLDWLVENVDRLAEVMQELPEGYKYRALSNRSNASTIRRMVSVLRERESVEV